MNVKKKLGLAGLVAGACATLGFLAYRISNGMDMDPYMPAAVALLMTPFYREAKRERTRENERESRQRFYEK